MQGIEIKNWVLAVDVEKTKMAYEFNSFRCMSEKCRNFVAACGHSMEDVVLQFAGQLGIDLSKPSQLDSHLVNDNSAIMYCGKYHVLGEIKIGEMDAWDIVLGEHCFSLTEELEMVPITMDGPIIEISFEVVLPWVLTNTNTL
ncbi:hypothetical protein CSE16_17905 [Solibacillus sp. R5-41]|uniref:hypothetical protein n=1 Tax=Solibacillus sp. R5-41 TaxID=2048654 RepID=UPI000C125F36|nr:hypothetical protein [Solibacillus sp. R5-41]ATP41756.1 hypothetical protein CSE16_17905 [Solibacillus sp. R5-41]